MVEKQRLIESNSNSAPAQKLSYAGLQGHLAGERVFDSSDASKSRIRTVCFTSGCLTTTWTTLTAFRTPKKLPPAALNILR